MSTISDSFRTSAATTAGEGAAPHALSPAEAQILRMIRAVRYGAVEVTIHDTRIVQVETREKLRVDAASEGRRV